MKIAEMYTCEFCGTEIDWEGADEHRGTIWGCEAEGCGKAFCRECFEEKHGHGTLCRMTNDDDVIRCPDCYAKAHPHN